MLTQEKADELIKMEKILLYNDPLYLPNGGEKLLIDAKSKDGKEKFTFDIYRGKIDLRKTTFQNRYRKVYKLLRLDIVSEKNFHINPDGTYIYGPHLHIYKEGYDVSWAEPFILNKNNADIYDYLFSFFKYCNVVNIANAIQMRLDNNAFNRKHDR